MRRKARQSADRQNTAAGLLLFLLAALVALSLLTESDEDIGPGWEFTGPAENASGVVGAYVSEALTLALGPFGAWGIPALLVVWGWNRLRKAPVRRLAVRCVLTCGLGVAFLSLLALWDGEDGTAWGGRFGESIAGLGVAVFGSWGVHFVLWAVFLALLFAVSELPLRLLGFLREPGAGLGRAIAGAPASLGARLRRFAEERAGAAEARRREKREREVSREAEAPEQPPKVISGGMEPPGGVKRAEAERGVAGVRAQERASEPKEKPRVDVSAAGEMRPSAGDGEFDLPGLDLLSAPEASQGGVREDEVMEASRTLQEALAHFGVRGKVGEVHPGPVITRYDFEPGVGVKVNQILSRQDDISLALRCQGIRIVAPIPGKAAVGIEVPNREPQVVYLKDLLSRPEFQNSESTLALTLGKTVSGNPYYADLASMPHLLIAGATGSGKSVCVNSIIMSLLYRLTADELKLLLIDPKRLELSGYNGIPHLLLPVVTDHKKAAGALRWVVHEMERRYKRLAAAGARDIASFNARAERASPAEGEADAEKSFEARSEPEGVRGGENGEGRGPGPEGDPAAERGPAKLPYLVVIIDELADLMVALPAEIEEPVTRLAQMARAVGIHLILATQRPSVDVITGLIKANFPCRIAFQVAAKVDSRTILDTNGAECLMGRGDMLFLPGGRPQPVRIHSPYVSPDETARVTEFLRAQASAAEEIGEEVRLDDKTWDDTAADEEIFKEAAKLVVMHQQGSTSLLQRRLRIGYSRAARIVDMLEQRGIVGPFKGSKAREVLVDEQYLRENRLM